MSLQQEEAKIDKLIEYFKKKVIQQNKKINYKIISSRKNSEIIIVFNRDDVYDYYILFNEKKNYEELNSLEVNPRRTLIYLQSTNPRDKRANRIGFLKHVLH